MKSTKNFLFFIYIFIIALFSLNVYAVGIAVVPDKLEFFENEKTFRIINPNEEDLSFQLNNDYLDCKPKKGIIFAKKQQIISCAVFENQTDFIDDFLETNIIIESELSSKTNTVGILPAVLVRAKIHSQMLDELSEFDKLRKFDESDELTESNTQNRKKLFKTSEQTSDNFFENLSSKTIGDVNETTAKQEFKKTSIIKTSELLTIVFLFIVIIGLVLYLKFGECKQQSLTRD